MRATRHRFEIMSLPRNTLDTLEDHLETERFRGYDPYDALTSPLFRLPVFRSSKWVRLAAEQALKRSAINLRPLLRIPKGYNPVTLAFVLEACAYRSRCRPRARRCVPGTRGRVSCGTQATAHGRIQRGLLGLPVRLGSPIWAPSRRHPDDRRDRDRHELAVHRTSRARTRGGAGDVRKRRTVRTCGSIEIRRGRRHVLLGLLPRRHAARPERDDERRAPLRADVFGDGRRLVPGAR